MRGSPPPAAGRSSITVAASRGVTGRTVPSSTSRARSANCGGSRIAGRAGGSVTDLYDQLDLDGCVERQDRRPDRAARVPARLPEHLEQEFAGTVDDLGLAGESRVAGHETGHLDHPGHR